MEAPKKEAAPPQGRPSNYTETRVHNSRIPFKRDPADEIRARFIDCARFQAEWAREYGLPEEVLEWARLLDKAESWGFR